MQTRKSSLEGNGIISITFYVLIVYVCISSYKQFIQFCNHFYIFALFNIFNVPFCLIAALTRICIILIECWNRLKKTESFRVCLIVPVFLKSKFKLCVIPYFNNLSPVSTSNLISLKRFLSISWSDSFSFPSTEIQRIFFVLNLFLFVVFYVCLYFIDVVFGLF